MQEQLEKLKNKISEIDRILNLDELKKMEIKYLGRKTGELTLILKGLAKLPLEQKKKFGAPANELKNEIKKKIETKKKQLLGKDEKIDIDVTLPTDKNKLGRLHPISRIQYEIEDIFTSMGFMVLDGPELESDYYCFKALNFPKNHPARDMQDTFFIEGGNEDNPFVMRTHTSPVQIRAMRGYGAPLRCIVPGQCYRNEAIDARHEFNLYQIEGLMIDKDVSIANMIAVIKNFLNAAFKKRVEVRLRPGYFPFVEPGFELDFKCLICGGKGCRVCKRTGWVEFMGAGMVHPNVLKAGKVDFDKYSGFAFGFGVERLLMMKYGIDEIRLFRSGDLRFLRQF